MEKNLKNYLSKYKIDYKEHLHKAVFTVAESKVVTKDIPGLHAKNLFLRDENDKFYLVCLPAEKRLDIKSLRISLGVKELHFASPSELSSELNITPGSVSIFCMIYAKTSSLIMDEELWQAKVVGFHPNENTSTLEITHENLEKFCNTLKHHIKIIKL